jgi:hypothetical protein
LVEARSAPSPGPAAPATGSPPVPAAAPAFRNNAHAEFGRAGEQGGAGGGRPNASHAAPVPGAHARARAEPGFDDAVGFAIERGTLG